MINTFWKLPKFPEIGSSVKPNSCSQVKSVHISDTQGRSELNHLHLDLRGRRERDFKISQKTTQSKETKEDQVRYYLLGQWFSTFFTSRHTLGQQYHYLAARLDAKTCLEIYESEIWQQS